MEVSAKCDCNCDVIGDASDMGNCDHCGLRRVRAACKKAHRRCFACQKTYKFFSTNIIKNRDLSVFALNYTRVSRTPGDANPDRERPLRPSDSELAKYHLILRPIPLPLCNKSKAQIAKLWSTYANDMNLNSRVPSATHLEQSLEDYGEPISTRSELVYGDLRMFSCITAIDGMRVRWCLNSNVSDLIF